jgi:hypothetical protein
LIDERLDGVGEDLEAFFREMPGVGHEIRNEVAIRLKQLSVEVEVGHVLAVIEFEMI